MIFIILKCDAGNFRAIVIFARPREVLPWHGLGVQLETSERTQSALRGMRKRNLTCLMRMPASLTQSSATRLSRILCDLFYCPACSVWRKRCATQKLPIRGPRKQRNASTLASSTAVNANKTIPTRNKELYESLNEVKKKAYAQVNLSRLQLAIQSLETDIPTTRVAVLGLSVSTTARRLVRLLLADALTLEEQWEKQLLSEKEDFSRGLLIRYGESPSSTLQQALQALPTLLIPASVLQRNNIEILVSSVNAPIARGGLVNGTTTTSDAFLSPTISTPANASGRQTMINQPVHKSLLVAKDLNELVGVAELLASAKFSSKSEAQMVDILVNLEGATGNQIEQTMVVDAQKAEAGLNAIRSSLEKATTYEHNWLDSGMPVLSRWLTLASAKDSVSLSAPVKNLITSLLNNASSTIDTQSKEAAESAELNSITENTRATLETAIRDFSYSAHAELQSGLAMAWSSRNWRKLAWYKLFWRVDDVSLILTDLISNAWLPRTEKAVYEISGRLLQAGIPPSDFEEAPAEVKVVAVRESVMASMEPLAVAGVASAGTSTIAPIPGQTDVVLQKSRLNPPSLASAISTARQAFMSRAITELTFSAQQIVLKTLTISGLSAGLSSLAFFSIAAGSIYESATIVALGTAYALRRMQGDWQTECKALEDGLLDAGRTVLRQTEERMRELVRDGRRLDEDSVETRTRREASEAVGKAKQALKKLSS
jgi:hypothetical protein